MNIKLKSVKEACSMCDSIFTALINNFSCFKTEKDVEKFILKCFKGFNVKPSFPPIVASGSNAFTLHHKPKNVKLKKGFCVIDFGVKVKGYCSDMTRTIFIGKPSVKEKALYKKVLDVQNRCIKMVKPGMECKKPDLYARKKLGKTFIHQLGHGVGRKIHMLPKIGPKSTFKFKVNEIFTIEPGVYVKGKYGIRIEDTLVVKRSGAESLSKSSKKLFIMSEID